MFRLECFCDDNKLHKVLHSLVGLLVKPPLVQPVANAKVEKKKIVAESEATTKTEIFINAVKTKFAGQAVIKDQFLDLGIGIGFARGSVQDAINQGIKAKVIKRIKRGHYKVL